MTTLKAYIIIALCGASLLSARLAAAQQPIPPVIIEAPGGQGPAITIRVEGVEVNPIPLKREWRTDCWADMNCFLSAVAAAASSGNLEQILQVSVPADRAACERATKQIPSLLSNMKAVFGDAKFMGVLGWFEWGQFRVVMIAHDGPNYSTVEHVELRRIDGRWMQTESIALDPALRGIATKVGEAIRARRPVPR